MLASQAFSVKTEKHWRKLTWEEVRFVFRIGFTEWQTLPDSVLTDNELGLGGHPSDPFPSSLTLWLTGLGIRHDFIRPHTPTDQPQIERNHRTLDSFTFDEDSRANIEAFQQSLHKERYLYNHSFPSQASDCNGQPPLVAHPELLQPRRPYRPECETILFDMQRVYDHLAIFTFDRKVNTNGQVSLKNQMYSIGRQHARLEIKVNFDSDRLQWVFWLPVDNEERQILACRPLKGLDFHFLTGLNPDDATPTMPVQLTFPLPP